MKRFKYLAVAAIVALGACDEGGDLTPSEDITGSLTVTVSAEGDPVDVTVQVAGPESDSEATGADGTVTFADLEAGAYTVSITGIPSDFAFANNVQTTTVDEDGATVNFSGSVVRTASIAGQVTADGSGVAGVTIGIEGPEGSQSAQTGSNGNYSFTGLRGGSYDITMTAITTDQAECAEATVTRQLAAGGSAVADFGCAAVGAGDATISIQQITTEGVAVDLNDVSGQIEVALNVDRAGNQIDSVQAMIDGKVVATQTFGAAGISGDEAEQAETIILSVATTQIVDVEGGTWAPAVFNGGANISANLFVSGVEQPVPSNSVPVIMNNEDKVLLITDDLTLVGDTPDPSITVDGTLWQTGNAAFDGAIYLAYSGLMPSTVDWPTVSGACDVSSSLAGTPSTGIVVTNDYDCSGDQGTVLPDVSAIDADYDETEGPDGSDLDAADDDDYVRLGATFELEGEMRRFIVPTTTATLPSALNLDNAGPTVWVDGEVGSDNEADKVAFHDDFDEWWVNATREFTEDLHATDGGVGIFIDPDDVDAGTDMSDLFARVWEDDGDSDTNDCVGADVEVGGDLPETITSDGPAPDFGHQVCAVGADALGNPAVGGGPSNFFGVDIEVPEVRLAGSDGPNEGDILAPTEAVEPVSEDPDATIYNIEGDGAGLGPAPTPEWGLEATDDRAGFSQVAVTDPGDDGLTGTLDDISFPAHQVLQQATADAQTYCGAFSAAGPLLGNDLAGEPWVRSDAVTSFLCAIAQPGYYKYWGYVVDRAGNMSEMLIFNWLDDEAEAATISAVSFGQPLYTPGEDAAFSVFGSDDLEVVGAALALDFPVPNRSEDDDDALSIDFGSFPIGERWGDVHGEDGEDLITPIVTNANAVLPGDLVFGRVDFTDATGATIDYTVDPEEDFLATGMSAWLMDAGMNDNMGASPANVETESFIPGQWTETTTAPWNDGVDLDEFIITWELQDQDGDRVAVHTASSSIVEPFFDNVLLVLNLQDGDGLAGGTPDTIIVCGMQATPTDINDDGISRFYSYELFTEPEDLDDLDDDDPCETPPTGSVFHAVGVTGTAALVTSQSVSIVNP